MAALSDPVLTEEFARAWVEATARAAGLVGLAEETVERVILRLVKGEREYGADNYRRISVTQLEREAAEECDDIIGWLVAASARDVHELATGGASEDEVQAKQLHYRRAGALALQAWRELQAARAS